ncbi:MAG: flagellar hook basal-body protein [Candidatus Limnocylindrales bacterium]|jgi:flagellar basal body rod protein FlgG
MIRGFYTALSGVISSMTRQSVVADNIANVNTVGFKQSQTTQDDFELQIMNSLGPELGELGTGAIPSGLKLDINQGPLQVTGVQTDLAVQGDGLFVVRTGGGTAYTRAGDFVVDVTGALVTQKGYPVLDTAGHTIQPGQTFTVDSDGTIVGTGQRIALVAWPPGGVTRLGENLYSAGGQLTPGSGQIRQSMLEGSNTDVALAMSDMISLQRNFQMSARALSLQDGTIGDATQLGRLR